ncbi:MAG: serine protease [Ruminococcus sp.]|nr:serine protease [Ruminococcus sp.]
MKLKKLSAVLAIILCACSTPFIQTNAVEEFSENNLADVITLHKWLKGQGNLDNWKKFDYNHDEKINIFDFVLMKKSIFKSAKPIISPASVELSKDMQSQEVTGKQADESFINGQTKFAVELLQNAVNESEAGQNIMVSPYSVVQALGMTANGANGETKTQMEQTIGSMPLEDLNQYLYTQRNSQPNDETCKLLTANSIWVRDEEERIQVKEEFLQTNADYYNASVFKAPFDDSTVSDINNWVKKNTDNMIPELLEEISDDTVMYLINAVTFDGKWLTPYTEDEVWNGIFTSADNSEQEVEMMHSDEYHYLEDENTTGFMKYYQGNRYAFVALLPNEDISINNYIANLTPESLQNLISNPKRTSVQAGLPKFSYDYEIELSETLSSMGMPVAFNPSADFSKMADTQSGLLYIDNVLHKTHIDVFEEGTKAAAVTSVAMTDECAVFYEKTVILDRPFVYAIVDTDTNLPMFMGVLNSVE